MGVLDVDVYNQEITDDELRRRGYVYENNWIWVKLIMSPPTNRYGAGYVKVIRYDTHDRKVRQAYIRRPGENGRYVNCSLIDNPDNFDLTMLENELRTWLESHTRKI